MQNLVNYLSLFLSENHNTVNCTYLPDKMFYFQCIPKSMVHFIPMRTTLNVSAQD